jgi:hypothetical protein
MIFLFVNAFSLAGLYREVLANCIRTSSKQPINLVAVGFLQGCKHSDVTGL